jgi:hypothetical protein
MDKYRYIKRGVVPALVATVIAGLATAGSAALTGRTAGAATALTFKYVTASQWPNSDGTRGFKADIEIGNKAGTTPVNGWTPKFTYPGDEKIGNLDNATYTQAGQNVTITSGPVSAYIPAGSGYVLSLTGLWAGRSRPPSPSGCPRVPRPRPTTRCCGPAWLPTRSAPDHAERGRRRTRIPHGDAVTARIGGPCNSAMAVLILSGTSAYVPLPRVAQVHQHVQMQ